MVMNTFRSKFRRRRNDFFRRSSDEDSDEWQFVAFNPSVYPSQPSGTVTHSKTNTVATLNGNYTSPAADHPHTPMPSHKAGLRPWALKRASWHDGPPPVPPHGNGGVKGQRPLPPCPEVSQAPTVPSHNDQGYPGSVPNWYGLHVVNSAGDAYPLSVPSGQPRPSNLEGVKEQPPIVLRRESSRNPSSRPTSGTSRISSSEDESSPVSPEGVPPLVPPHGRPAVPLHVHNPPSHPPPPVPPYPCRSVSPPPPPPPPHAGDVDRGEPMGEPLPLALINPLLLQPLPPSPPCSSSSSGSVSSESPVSPGEGSNLPPLPPPALLEPPNVQGEKVGVGGGGKEQRRSDPGGNAGGHGGSLPNHHNPSNGASGEEDQQHSTADDADHGATDSHSNAAFDNPPNNVSRSQSSHKKRSGSSINRSESCKEKHHARKQARENRKNSDPNIPTSKAGDVDGENPLTFHSGSSSNSSISQSQESPPGNSVEQVEAFASALDNDSDIEAEADLPDWTQRLSPEVVERLSSKDRKRQETINEFFHTEQSHVRVLKILQFLFHQPLRQSGYVSTELLDRLFPNLDQMLKFHTSFNKAMKKRRQETPLVNNIGDILSSMFDGEEGAQFQQAAAEFVACQSFGLESLKQHQKRDQKLAIFLQEQENHPHCRRLQLKDMLPAGFQRLSKYPLLLESLLSFTDRTKQPEEHEQIAKALDRSKEILAHVNAAVQDAENKKRLSEIQKRLDQSALAKNKHANCEELKGELDLTKHKLVHEGPLTWKTSRGQKNIDLHVLILEDCVVLLQKDSDKFVLKYHSMNKSLGKDDKLNLSPIIKFGTFLCREIATDKCGIFIIVTQASVGAQIYELVTASPSERSIWLRHLHDAQANYSAGGRNRRPHPPPHLPDPDESTPSGDLRDVEDVDVENESIDANNECLSAGTRQEALEGAFNNTSSSTPPSAPPTPSSPETVSKKTELLRRKDIKIRQELEEKQNLIADILNIPRQDFESVADMAGEVGLSNKDPRELALGAIYQAKKLQETLNEAQTIRDSDVIAAQASNESVSKSFLPLYNSSMDTMEKLLSISGTLTQFLNSLMIIISERDEERERMRKELVASRERVHQLHMQQNLQDQTTACEGGSSGQSQTTSMLLPTIEAPSPHSSRPNSFVSVNSSVADQSDTTDQHNTDEEARSDDPAHSSGGEIQSASEASTEKFEEASSDATGEDETAKLVGSGGDSSSRPEEESGST